MAAQNAFDMQIKLLMIGDSGMCRLFIVFVGDTLDNA